MADDMPKNKSLVTATRVIAGLDPAIHHLKNVLPKLMDTRVKPAYDDWK
jgi:hypothetical protein